MTNFLGLKLHYYNRKVAIFSSEIAIFCVFRRKHGGFL